MFCFLSRDGCFIVQYEMKEKHLGIKLVVSGFHLLWLTNSHISVVLQYQYRGNVHPSFFPFFFQILTCFTLKHESKAEGFAQQGKKYKKQQILDSLLFKSGAKTALAGTKERSPSKTLKTTDHGKCSIWYFLFDI